MTLAAMLMLLLLQGTEPKVSNSIPGTIQNTENDSGSLLNVKRVYVDSFGDDPVSKEMQSMIVSALVASKRFKVTENREHADAVLKGVALQRTSQELHSYGEGTAVRNAAVLDSSAHTETVDYSRLAVRLVNADGDVIWTTTQESKGAKYKGANADVAEMCVKRLVNDITRQESGASAIHTSGNAPRVPYIHPGMRRLKRIESSA